MALLAETLDALLGDGISPAGAPLDEAEAEYVAQNLLHAQIRGKCKCGQDDCNTYYFFVPEKPRDAVRYSTVSLYSRGEHLVHIDSQGDVYEVERLYDFSGGRRWVASLMPDGSWQEREV